MTAVPVDVARLEALAEKAQEWPTVYVPPGTHIGPTTGRTLEVAEFIAAMRNAAPSLLAAYRAVERVRALHVKVVEEGWVDRCDACEYAWPCSTVQALDGAA